jgi:hypothetical protein
MVRYKAVTVVTAAAVALRLCSFSVVFSKAAPAVMGNQPSKAGAARWHFVAKNTLCSALLSSPLLSSAFCSQNIFQEKRMQEIEEESCTVQEKKAHSHTEW